MAKGMLDKFQAKMGWTNEEMTSFIGELKMAMEKPQKDRKSSLEESVTDFLWEIGCSPNLKGFKDIRTALILLIENERKYDRGFTTFLYPDIAKKYGTTWTRVERNIRHGITKMFDNPNDIRDYIFANMISYDKGKPTNMEFLYGCVEYLKHNI